MRITALFIILTLTASLAFAAAKTAPGKTKTDEKKTATALCGGLSAELVSDNASARQNAFREVTSRHRSRSSAMSWMVKAAILAAAKATCEPTNSARPESSRYGMAQAAPSSMSSPGSRRPRPASTLIATPADSATSMAERRSWPTMPKSWARVPATEASRTMRAARASAGR